MEPYSIHSKDEFTTQFGCHNTKKNFNPLRHDNFLDKIHRNRVNHIYLVLKFKHRNLNHLKKKTKN